MAAHERTWRSAEGVSMSVKLESVPRWISVVRALPVRKYLQDGLPSFGGENSGANVLA
jgi:hypothetical protein